MNLVLLIGTNPLPNYVVVKHFLESKTDLKNVFFVHSSLTKYQSSSKEYADNIIKILELNEEYKNINFKYVALNNIENQNTNINDLNSVFSEINPDEKIHLNYTGGTKTMGIHVYNFLKEKFGENFESSYLSAKIFKLINENGELISDDLRKKISINFPDLLTLHGFVRANKDSEYNFEKAIVKYEEYINNNSIVDYFHSYPRKEFIDLKSFVIDKKGGFDKNLTINGKLLEINNLLPNDFQLFDELGNLIDILPSNEKVINTIGFIDGKWLEEYFFKIIEDNIKNDVISLKNWEIKKPSWSEKLRFEIDIILINGYQLCGVSITTIGKKANCKHKGFEIIMRTRQIGGDESKSVLITRMNEYEVKELQNELEIDTGGTSKNILVLGKNDFKKNEFLKKIKIFLEVNE